MHAKGLTRFNAFLLIALILFWGSSFVIVKIILNEGLTPIAIATFRFLIAGAFFVIAILVGKTRKNDYASRIQKRDTPIVLVLALSGVTFFFIIQYTGIQMAGASIAAIFVCLLSPVLITSLSALTIQEHLTGKQAIGVGVAALGTLIVIAGGTPDISQGPSFFSGSLILLLTPLLWATYTLLGKKIMHKYSPFLLVAYVNALGGLFLVPFSVAEGSIGQALTMSPTAWVAILFLSLTCSLLGYYIWFYSVNTAGAAITSSFLFAEPLVTILFATSFVGEKITVAIAAGGLLIFTGVYLVARK